MRIDNPYVGLPARQYWSRAVASLEPTAISDLGSPKNQVATLDFVATAGSCFAQHISRHLRTRGFRFLDVELPPSLLKPNRYADYGFNLYSARYGNVYTSRQFRQLVERAYGRFAPVDAIWMKDNRFFDPFRPAIELGGFASVQELEADRSFHLANVRRLLLKTNVFVFTLGLTETWGSKADGAVYPMAPGVRGIGSFDPQRYEFINLNYAAVLEDMEWVFAFLRRRNSALRFILSVSPVSLAATATSEHVITATTHSKSVLRAVAGELAQRHSFVDYFPAYELVTSPVFGDWAYDDDKRDVKPAAVERVMEYFFNGFATGAPPAERRVPSLSTAEKQDRQDDLICEEVILASYASG